MRRKAWLRSAWEMAREPLTSMALLVGLVAVAVALSDWGRFAQVDSKSFLIGFGVAAGTLFMAMRHHIGRDLADPTVKANADERHAAAVALDRAAARRNRLECRRLRRELAEDDWRDGRRD